MGLENIARLHASICNLDIASIQASLRGWINLLKDQAKQILIKVMIAVSCGFGITLRSLNEKGKATGILIKGNLLILNPMIGAITIMNLYNKILFIEDRWGFVPCKRNDANLEKNWGIKKS